MIRMLDHDTSVDRDTTVYVVDRNAADYRHLLQDSDGHAEDGGRTFAFLADARSALRVNPSTSRAVWIINFDLPDMPGLDLREMLRSRFPASPFYIVGDEYHPEQERAARIAGASLYFCKPIQQEWLDQTRARAIA